jgi:hypothetical protein
LAESRYYLGTVAVETGTVNETKLRELLAEQHESDAVEYKDVWDLDDRRHILELALPVGAMQSIGGHIVVGVDDRGRPTGNLTDRNVALFDGAVIDDKIGRYLPPPIDVRVGRHQADGANVVLIYVPRRPEGLTAFLGDGTYSDETGRQRFVFREGDVYTRRATGEPVAGGVSFVRRCVGVEHDRVLEQEALVAVGEGGRVSARAVVRAAPGREVELAGLTRSSSLREGVDQLASGGIGCRKNSDLANITLG